VVGGSCDLGGGRAATRTRRPGIRATVRKFGAAGAAFIVASSLALCSCPAGASASQSAYRIQQRAGESTAALTVSPLGLRYELLTRQRRGGRVHGGHRRRPLVGTIIRYHGRELLLLDPPHRRYQRVSLRSALSEYEAELKLLQKAQPSNRLPPPPGTAPGAPGPLKQPRARLRALPSMMRIGSLTARAFELRQGTLRERLWYSPSLPKPPAAVTGLLSGALRHAGSGTLGRVLGAQADQIPLRVEDLKGKRWIPLLRTVHLNKTTLSAAQLKPPRAYRPGILLPPKRAGKAHASDVPANPIRCGLGLNCLIPALWGPVSGHPSVWAIFWGPRFSEHTDVVSSLNHALEDFTGDEFADPSSGRFWQPLEQYGVGRGNLQGYEIDSEKPDASVGSWNVFDVSWLVLTHRFRHGEPDYWWRFSDNDPIYAIFVDESEVDTSGWAGYHAFAPTEGILFFFLVHPALPFFIVKVPSLANLTHNHESSEYHTVIDTATERASHEFVEAATDPYPFLSWADPLKEPIWENGEIADICEEGIIAPWGKYTRLSAGGVAVQPYWSNESGCVPDARPQVHISYPAAESTVFWGTPATFVLQGEDLFDGYIPDSEVHWGSDRDGPIGTGNVLTTTHLSPGVHTIFAEVRDSVGGYSVSNAVRVNVIARPPVAKIESPGEGATFGSNQVINFRGAASDPSQGDLGERATWSVDGTQVGTGAALLRYRIPTEGEHTVTLAVTNDAHLSASASIKVKIGPPVKGPSVGITSPANGESFPPQTEIHFSAVADGEPPFKYSWSDEPDGFLSNEQSFTRILSGGCEIITHHVTVIVTDGNGETGSDTVTVTEGTIC
jgi:Bacterial Ig domain